MKKVFGVIIIIAAVLILVCAFNRKFIIYYGKQVLSRNVKEFTRPWQPQDGVASFQLTYRDDDLRLARLELGASSKHVRDLYGAPLHTKTVQVVSPNNADYIVYCTYWIYPDFEVAFENSAEKDQPRPKDMGHLFLITVKTGKFQSYRGIKVGDSLDLVKKRYGVPSKNIYDDQGSLFYEWQLSYIKFGKANEKVSEIELGENAD